MNLYMLLILIFCFCSFIYICVLQYNLYKLNKDNKNLKEEIYDLTIQLEKARTEYRKLKNQFQDKLNEKQERINNLDNELEKYQKLEKQDNDFRTVYDLIKQGENVFITGGAGTGKSYILQNLKKFIPELKNNITSTTGISAINIDGVTINSWAKFWFKFDYSILKPKEEIKKTIFDKAEKSGRYALRDVKEKIKKTKILAIDEISMLSDDTFEFLDLYFQKIRHSNEPFGGIQMVIIGDFCQLPPVISNKAKNDKSFHYAFLSESWKNLNLKSVLLKTFHRQKKDIEFAKYLDNLRFGKNIDAAEKYLSECIITNSDGKKDMMHVFLTNNDVKVYNKGRLQKLSTEEFQFEAQHFFVKPQEKDGQIFYKKIQNEQVDINDYMIFQNGEEIDLIEKDTKALNLLNLKVGCKVMVIKNINVEEGIANGSIGHVSRISEEQIYVDFANKKNYPIKKEEFIWYNECKKEHILRRQYPLVLAYAITIHKSQGLTFDEGIVIGISKNNIENPGQAYVSMSRVRTKDKLYILNNFPSKQIIADENVVKFYEELEKSTNIK